MLSWLLVEFFCIDSEDTSLTEPKMNTGSNVFFRDDQGQNELK